MRRLFLALFAVGSAVSLAAQQTPAPSPGPAPAQVRIVAPVTEGEVGQTVTFRIEAFDAAGARIDVKPTAWFATPFDVGVAEPSGDVTFFEAGELTVGVIVGGKPTTMSVRVKPQAVARLDVAPLAGPARARRRRAASCERVHEDRRAAERCPADLGLRRAGCRERGRGRPRDWRRDWPRDDSGQRAAQRPRPCR